MATKGRNFGRTAAAPQDPTKVPPGIDSSTYFAPQIPDEIKELVPIFHRLTSTTLLHETLQHIINHLNGNELTDEQFLSLQRQSLKLESTEPPIDYGIFFTGLYSLIRIAIRYKIKNEIIRNDLIKMNVPSAVVDDIIRAIRASRFDIERAALVHRIRFPRLEKLRWRVDVIISSGSLSRVLRPTILMQMVLSNKIIKTFEVSVDQFSQLRVGVAKVRFSPFPPPLTHSLFIFVSPHSLSLPSSLWSSRSPSPLSLSPLSIRPSGVIRYANSRKTPHHAHRQRIRETRS
jgi:hypothetical protein